MFFIRTFQSYLKGNSVMKSTLLRMAVAGSMVVGAAAHADVILPSTGNGELVLYVHDNTTGTTYARGIQIQNNTVLPPASILPKTGSPGGYVSAVTTSYVLPTITADANLTAFMGGTHASDSFSWGIQSGSTSSGNAPGKFVYTFTTGVDLTQPANVVSSNQLSVGYNALEASDLTLNGQINSGTPGDGASTPATGDGLWGRGSTQDPQNWFGNGPNTAIALGTASTLYTLTGNGTNVTAQVYLAGEKVTLLANGTLEAVASAVPLPAAIWLLGSGLLGLAGIGRRRAVAA